MPASPEFAFGLARHTLRLYLAAEQALIELVVRLFMAGEPTGRPEQQLARVTQLRRGTQRIVAELAQGSAVAVDAAVRAGYNRGVELAAVDLAEVPGAASVALVPPGDEAARALVDAAVGANRERLLPIMRIVEDAFRGAVFDAARQVVEGRQTRRQASAQLVSRLGEAGLRFVDSRGRRWEMGAYAEMAVRTAAGQALVQGHLDRFQAAGHDLVQVSDAPEECSLCLVPGTVVEGPVPTCRSRLEYTGDIVSITTASGKHLTGTPDHAVLTPHGWRRLQDLRPGDQVISHSGQQRYPGVVPDDVQMPAFIEEAGKSWAPLLLASPTRRDFDRNRSYREIRYMPTDGDLLTVERSAFVEPFGDLRFVGGVGAAAPSPGMSSLDQLAFGYRPTAGGGVCGFEHGGSLRGSCVLPASAHTDAGVGRTLLMGETGQICLDPNAPWSCLDSGSPQPVRHRPAADTERGTELLGALTRDVPLNQFGGLLGRQLADADAAVVGRDTACGENGDRPLVADIEGGLELLKSFAGSVAPDKVVAVGVRHYSGHVWDLSTEPAWFLANGIVTHNCRPWEKRILSISGRTMGTVGLPSPLGGTATVHVRGSVAEAKAAGLWHANCRHSVSLFIPGVTQVPLVQRTADPEGNELRQRQRALERAVRVRRRQLAALAEARKTAAAAAGRKTLPPTDPVEVEYRRVRGLERAALARHDAFIAQHGRKRLAYRFNPVHR